ncbi:MAG: hypothetical protein ACI3W5_17350 [Faecousia sp.]
MRSMIDELRRAIFSKGFIFTVALVFAMYFIDGNQALDEYTSVLSLLEMISGIGAFKWVVPCVGTLCYAGSFVGEFEKGYVRYCITRKGVGHYAVQKSIAVCISAFFAVFIAILAYAAYAHSVCKELLNPEELANYLPYIENVSFYNLIDDGQYVIYILLQAALRGMAAGMWSIAGLLLSTVWKNTYVAIFSPAVIVYFKDYVMGWFSINPAVTLKSMEMGALYVGGTVKPLVIITSTFLLISAVFTACTYLNLRRGLANA